MQFVDGKLKSWLPQWDIESGAWEQIKKCLAHPELGSHLAIMPDCHQGYGVPIGCVLPTIGSVIPNAVGVDIGCGVAAWKTSVQLDETMDKNFWRSWMGNVQRTIPTGFHTHQQGRPVDFGDLQAKDLRPLIDAKGTIQIGTLGGGNHFLEAGHDEDGFIWFLVHSGSRHIGLKIANHYHALAKEQSEQRGLAAPRDLASLLLESPEGHQYIQDMTWAMAYAKESRRQMVEALCQVFDQGMITERIDVPHNYAEVHQHVALHRKGATEATHLNLGVIPGSMGRPSYIVRGTDNPDSHRSCSHGAGRCMGRGKAKATITDDQFARSLEGTHSKASSTYKDEAPDAYKDITVVMSRQTDLVEVLHVLQPIITVKGGGKDEG